MFQGAARGEAVDHGGLGGAQVRLTCRSTGVLTPDQVAQCRRDGVALAYDPLQIGWVTAQCRDDFAASPVSATPLVSLRNWRASDAAVYARYLSDPLLWRYMPDPAPGTVTETAARDLIALNAEATHHHVQAIVSDERPVGQVRVQYNMSPGVAELSYWIGHGAWGRGYGSAGVRAYLAQVLPGLTGVKRLIARVHGHNRASQAVIRKAGFAQAGTDPERSGWLLFTR